MAVRPLTKSRFKVGNECATKLFYLDNPVYGNAKLDNPFLKALAEGGFQVGELAKVYYPTGVEVTEIDRDAAVAKTSELLRLEKIVLFEGAVRYGDLFLRADVIVKDGNAIDLIEVKSKSINSDEHDTFYNKTLLKKGIKQLHSEWEPYIIDAAFQAYVLKAAYPHFRVRTFLGLVDKSKRATVDGLNQRFVLKSAEDDRNRVLVKQGTNIETVGESILFLCPIDEEVDLVHSGTHLGMSFAKYLEHLAETYIRRIFRGTPPTKKCKSCEFRISSEMKKEGLNAGFDECMVKAKAVSPDQVDKPFVFDVWNFRKADELFESGKVLIEQLEESDLVESEDDSSDGLTPERRRLKQVQLSSSQSDEPFIDRESLSQRLRQFRYPFHMIDFETARIVIPYRKDEQPYGEVAFQFSHHVLHEDGRVEHRTEFLFDKIGQFPSYEFVRALRKALSGDEGTIFRFHNHENTVLRGIRLLLEHSNEPDKESLINFIDSVTRWATGKKIKGKTEYVSGARAMVDLYDLVLKYFIHRTMGGSNSIKVVLPAVLQSSKWLQARYAAPIYGTGNYPSLNFPNQVWVRYDDNGNIEDPYKLLDPILSDVEKHTLDALMRDDRIADGGAAMTAYAKMQFTEMSGEERGRVSKALLKYCELDTLAMVMIMEYFRHEADKAPSASTSSSAAG